MPKFVRSVAPANSPAANTVRAAGFFSDLFTGASIGTMELVGTVSKASGGALERGQQRGIHLSGKLDRAFAQEILDDCLAEGMTEDQAQAYVNALVEKSRSLRSHNCFARFA